MRTDTGTGIGTVSARLHKQLRERENRTFNRTLSGIELYGDKLAAVRELLQNAFDAVRERIARHRLKESSDPNLLSQLYVVELKMEKIDNEFWLICKDQGAGMNKQIINDHLLVSGASRRTDLITLSRSCEAAGFYLERTAKFGIGVLSYFMLSDHIAINTKRCQIAGDSETHGWTFSTEGLGSFGELRKSDHSTTAGTEVRLRLRPEVLSSLEEIESYWTDILEYLKKTLINIPCRFLAQSEFFPEGSLKYQQAGWVRSPEEYSSISFPTLTPISHPEMYRDGPADILPENKLSIRHSLREQTEKRQQTAQQALHWTEPITGTLPNNFGEYRFSIPYFKLPGGNCFHFIHKLEKKDDYLTFDTVNNLDQLFFAPKCPLTMSWFGIHVEYDEKQLQWPGGILLEIDWKSENAGTIEVNRNKIILQENTLKALDKIFEVIKTRYEELAEKWTESPYTLYNHRIAHIDPPRCSQWHWYSWNPDTTTHKWQAIQFPVAAPVHEPPVQMAWKGYLHCGKHIQRFSQVSATSHMSGSTRYCINRNWYSNNMPPDRVVCIIEYGFQQRQEVGCLWENIPTLQKPRLKFPEAQFPPEWQELCVVVHGKRVIWNKDHGLVRIPNIDTWNQLLELLDAKADPRPIRDQFINNQTLSVAWILLCMTGQHRSLWTGLVENEPDLLQEIWTTTQISTDCIWAYIDDISSSLSGLCSISPAGWKQYDDRKHSAIYAQHMPIPSSEWCLEVEQPTDKN